ncbi:unnamed protein product [Ilex paraguariensis]|uniref:Uncharacterized protein n=1 Tax=Ilex paraguariensis TaxID=185542 RepID=A0ABC8V4N4_9AQUA
MDKEKMILTVIMKVCPETKVEIETLLIIMLTKKTSSFPKPPPLSNKPTVSLASSNPKNDQTHTKYIQKGSSPTHVIPENIKELIKEDIVPGVSRSPCLRRPTRITIMLCFMPRITTLSLKTQIPESDMFRANAAFRELDGVPFDILPSCLYEGECFSCPPRVEISKYKVILSTFMSSFRLHDVGIVAGHFSHIFLVDASSATEPETLVTLANLANENTVVVVIGAPRNHSGWVRSTIARYNGLLCSFFERLRQSELYNGLDPKFVTQLQERGEPHRSFSFL